MGALRDPLAGVFPRDGSTGIRFRIANQNVDLLPFGDLEDPQGTITPPTRSQSMSVWAFAEVYRASVALPLTRTLTIQIPTIPGYAATKLAAWLDRSAWFQTKDAHDLALIAFWYADSHDVQERLYDTAGGQQVLVAEDVDIPRAGARVLGRDVSAVAGEERMTELRQRWPGDLDMLVNSFTVGQGPQVRAHAARRREVLDALTRGLTDVT